MEIFGNNDLIIQWTTSHGLTSHTWRIPLAPLALAGYVIFVIGMNLIAAKKKTV